MNQTTDHQPDHPTATCPLCASETSEILAHQLRRGNGMVRYCPACDHGYLVQAVDAKEYYGEQYRQEYSHNAEAAATHAREIYRVYKNYQQDRLHHISPHLTAGSRLLEVGASAGQFQEMRAVNRKYIAKLIAAKCTSNMLMKLRHD